jgi:uncharacterized membrane protein YqjE
LKEVVWLKAKILGLALATLLVAVLALNSIPSQSAIIVIAFDLSNRQSPKGLEVLVEIAKPYYKVLIVSEQADLERVPPEVLKAFDEVRVGGLTAFNLRDVDVLIIGQPEALIRSEAVEAIKAWFSKPNRALWIAGDSDYPAQGSEKAQQSMNAVLEAIGSVIRIDYISVEDYRENIGRAAYRVAGIVDPSPEVAFLKNNLKHNRVLFHGPGGLYVLVQGQPVNPVKQPELKPKNVYVVVRTSENSRAVEHQTPERGGLGPMFYDPLNDKVNTGPFPLMLIEVFPDNRVVIASSETMYGGYAPMTVTEYRGVPLDGPQFVTNLITYMVSVVSQPIKVTETKVVTETKTEVKTETITVTEERTTTVQVGVSTPVAALIAVIALLIGAVAVFLLRR